MDEQREKQGLRISFDMGLSKFQETISGNFRAVQSKFAQQRSEIDRLSAALEAFKEEMASMSKRNERNEAKNDVQKEKDDILGEGIEKLNEQSGEKIAQ